MVKPLRKTHAIVWTVLAAVLPITFVLALTLRPSSQVSPLSNSTFGISMTPHTDSTNLIVIEVQRPLTVPSCSVYSNDQLLGLLGERGTYEFIVPATKATDLKFIDFINGETIESRHLSINEVQK